LLLFSFGFISARFFAFLTTGGKTVLGASFAGEVVGVAQHNLLTSRTYLEFFFKEYIAYQLYVVGGSFIYLRNNALTEYCGYVVSGV
jgi:hypothetical protein